MTEKIQINASPQSKPDYDSRARSVNFHLW